MNMVESITKKEANMKDQIDRESLATVGENRKQLIS